MLYSKLNEKDCQLSVVYLTKLFLIEKAKWGRTE